MILNPQCNHSGLYVNNETSQSNRSLSAAAYILTMVALSKLLWFTAAACFGRKNSLSGKLSYLLGALYTSFKMGKVYFSG